MAIRVWLFLHYLGFMLWLGAGLASLVIGVRGRKEDRQIQGAVTRLQMAMHRSLIGPGAFLVVISGIGLTVVKQGYEAVSPSVWLWLMQLAGVVGAILVLFVSLPTSYRLARVSPVGDTARLFDALRRRQAQVGTVAGTLALLALIAGAMNQ